MKVSYVDGKSVFVEAAAILIPGERLELIAQGEVLASVGLAPSLRGEYRRVEIAHFVPTALVEWLEERVAR